MEAEGAGPAGGVVAGPSSGSCPRRWTGRAGERTGSGSVEGWSRCRTCPRRRPRRRHAEPVAVSTLLTPRRIWRSQAPSRPGPGPRSAQLLAGPAEEVRPSSAPAPSAARTSPWTRAGKRVRRRPRPGGCPRAAAGPARPMSAVSGCPDLPAVPSPSPASVALQPLPAHLSGRARDRDIRANRIVPFAVFPRSRTPAPPGSGHTTAAPPRNFSGAAVHPDGPNGVLWRALGPGSLVACGPRLGAEIGARSGGAAVKHGDLLLRVTNRSR